MNYTKKGLLQDFQEHVQEKLLQERGENNKKDFLIQKNIFAFPFLMEKLLMKKIMKKNFTFQLIERRLIKE